MTDQQKQDLLTQGADAATRHLQEKYRIGGFAAHAHCCTYEMLCYGSLDKANKQCDEWRRKHSIQFPKNWPRPIDRFDYCDFCEMFNYVARDDEGRIIFVRRNNPDKLRKWLDSHRNS